MVRFMNEHLPQTHDEDAFLGMPKQQREKKGSVIGQFQVGRALQIDGRLTLFHPVRLDKKKAGRGAADSRIHKDIRKLSIVCLGGIE